MLGGDHGAEVRLGARLRQPYQALQLPQLRQGKRGLRMRAHISIQAMQE